MAKTPCSQCRGHKFDPWSGNEILHATTKDPTLCKKFGRSRVLQLRPGTAKYKLKKTNLSAFKSVCFHSCCSCFSADNTQQLPSKKQVLCLPEALPLPLSLGQCSCFRPGGWGGKLLWSQLGLRATVEPPMALTSSSPWGLQTKPVIP